MYSSVMGFIEKKTVYTIQQETSIGFEYTFLIGN